MNQTTEFLAEAARLLLEYNESTGEIHRTIEATSRALTEDKSNLVVAYGRVTLSVGDDRPVLVQVREMRYNAALQARVHAILAGVRRRELPLSAALEQLKRLEAETPHHPKWVSILLLGCAGSALAAILGADRGAVTVAGVATALGLAARQQLGRFHFNFLTLPLAAGFIGALLGGLAFQFGWTHTPGLALIVPSLMVVPGPHLINGLLDLVDNYISIGLSRLGLATIILIACAAGIVIGIELTLPDLPLAGQGTSSDHLNIFTDMFLAGMVTIGFAVFYNTTWALVGLATLGGMIGHGLRFGLLELGWKLEVATFFGALAVGIVSACIVRSYKVPIAVVSFAGAVTMMPGIQIYRALGGARHLARLHDGADWSLLGRTIGDVLQSSIVTAALALGLIIAARLVPIVMGEKSSA